VWTVNVHQRWFNSQKGEKTYKDVYLKKEDPYNYTDGQIGVLTGKLNPRSKNGTTNMFNHFY
jgi:hypothetical protein